MRLGEFKEDPEKQAAMEELVRNGKSFQGKTDRELWKDMDPGQKRGWFVSYILPRILIAAGAVFVVLLLVFNFFLKPETRTGLYVAVMNGTLEPGQRAALTDAMNKAAGAGKQEDGSYVETILDDEKYEDRQGTEMLEVLLFNESLDVVVMEKEAFRAFAANGNFLDLTTILTEADAAAYGNALVSVPGYAELSEEEIQSADAYNDPAIGTGPSLPYGLSLLDSAFFRAADRHLSDPVLAVAANTKNPEAAARIIHFLMTADAEGKE